MKCNVMRCFTVRQHPAEFLLGKLKSENVKNYRVNEWIPASEWRLLIKYILTSSTLHSLFPLFLLLALCNKNTNKTELQPEFVPKHIQSYRYRHIDVILSGPFLHIRRIFSFMQGIHIEYSRSALQIAPIIKGSKKFLFHISSSRFFRNKS